MLSLFRLHVKTRKIETAFAALERKQYSGKSINHL